MYIKCKCREIALALGTCLGKMSIKFLVFAVIIFFFANFTSFVMSYNNCREMKCGKVKLKEFLLSCKNQLVLVAFYVVWTWRVSLIYFLPLNFPLENVWLLGVWCAYKHFLCYYSFPAGVAKWRLASELSPERGRDSLPSNLSKWRDFHGVQYKFMAYY